MIFQSKRLQFRSVEETDLPFFLALMTNPLVMERISSGKPRTPQEIEFVLQKSLRLLEEDPHFGHWVVTESSTGIPVGNFILRKPATEEEIEGLEIGYSFLPEFWNKGYATESAARVLEFVKEKYGDVRIIALIQPDHSASRKVLLKLNFKTIGTTTYVSPADGQKFLSEILELTY